MVIRGVPPRWAPLIESTPMNYVALVLLLSLHATDGLVVRTPPLSARRRALILSTTSTMTASSSSTAVKDFPAPPGALGPGFSFSVKHVEIEGVRIPVALWRPRPNSGAEGVEQETYKYVIDIGKIASRLNVQWLQWLPKFTYDLPVLQVPASPLPSGCARAQEGDAIVFAHGFLGSCLDMAHAAEALAQDGYTVVAPEMPESLSATYVPPDGLTREQIIARARDLACTECGLPAASNRWGIFGHSAGAGSAISQGGSFALGRCLLCPGYRGYEGDDPVFLVASDGDGVTQLMASRGVVLRDVLGAETAAASGGPQDHGWTFFASPEEAYAVGSGEGPPPKRGAFIFEEGRAALTQGERLPNHISFLWREVDEAMASLLAPLVPLAKLLGLFLLDFDVYLEARDADATASRVVPAVRRFFASNGKAAQR